MSVVQGMAIALTIFRVSFRLHIRRFWWEDAWAAIAGSCGIVHLISSWVHLFSFDIEGTTRVVSFWATTLMTTCINWSARMSILFAIARVARPTQRLYQLSMGFAILFFLTWGGLIAGKARETELSSDWYELPWPSCRITYSMAAYQLATKSVADTILVVFSFRLLWNVSLPSRQRRMILAIFSSSIIMTMFSLFRAITNFLLTTWIEVIAVNLELSFSLIICNLLVVVTYAYRVLNRKPDDLEDDDYSGPIPSVIASQQLTTIALSFVTAISPSFRSLDPPATFIPDRKEDTRFV
ncbi:uncharacterized protein EDB93DRAFT_598670 [Suillus bovinus]|uniref:uncharacterized protein n=1 Tax=Suillus bovinus TaxID=48563 RepID=UPI001B867F17|nr:uncharacterized protein EDB93DRAFT_598670 [Suillus bovinus]KAG2142903.1 hypothetical protein EDB93DRAFT_598670 [Suillus bovinus]